jgi:hypothetical protein
MKNFRKLLILTSIACLCTFCYVYAKKKQHFRLFAANKQATVLVDEQPFKDADIIFQSSQSVQCKAVKLATKSVYSHCGLIFKDKGKYFVYEAVQPVKITTLKEWIARGENEHFVVKRLKNADKVLTEMVLEKMKAIGKKHIGKNYDLYFGWSDDKIYCSELVWKIYKEGANIEVGKLKKLSDFDLTSAEVKALMQQRYGKNVPLNETVISPADIFESEELESLQQ